MNSIPFIQTHTTKAAAATAARMSMSHFLFPPTLFAHSFCQLGGNEHGDDDSSRAVVDKMSKSFTIDSLLGLSNAAARAVLQSGISHHHHHHHHQSAINLANSIRSDCWRFENDFEYSDISNEQGGGISSETSGNNLRYHPYNNDNPRQSQSQTNSFTTSSSATLTTSFTGGGRTTKVSNSNTNKKNSSAPAVATLVTDKSSVDAAAAAAQIIRRAAKTKRVRTIFTPEQLERLEGEFERQQYMVGPERLYLASSLNLTEAQVKVWFQNRRIKWRKQHFEMQQHRLAVLRSQQTDLEDEDSTSSCDFGSFESMSPNNVAVASSSILEPPEIIINTSNKQTKRLQQQHPHKDLKRK